ncbi:hypothetical protein JCM11641_008240 [Rhodosporidiobolus odoratus]
MKVLALLGLASSSIALSTINDSTSSSILSRRATTTCTNGFSAVRSTIANRGACECRSPKVTTVDGQSCVSSCLRGSYNGGSGACVSCPDTVATCTDANTATSCSKGYFLSGTTCVSSCPLNTYVNSKASCVACADADAAQCSNNGATAISCMTKYLYNGVCLDATVIPSGYYADTTTNTVKACDATVKTCTGTGPGQATSCARVSGVQYYLTLDGNCKRSCASNEYIDKRLNACEACDSTALTCDAAGAITCGKDSEGVQFFLTPTKKCVFAENGPAGYWPDYSTNTFAACQDGATSCLGSGAGEALTCGKQADGTPVFWTPAAGSESCSGRCRRTVERGLGDCVVAASCPAATWADSVTSTCVSCDEDETACTSNGEGSALACKSGLYLSADHNCLTADQCKASGAYFPDADTGACSTCDPGELACTDNGLGFATACGTNTDGAQLYLYQGDCVAATDCPTAYFADGATKSCQACDAGALTCTGHSAALTCGASAQGGRLYLNIDGMCVNPGACDASTFPDAYTRHCESCSLLDEDAATCTTPTTLTCTNNFFWESACTSTCPSRYYGNTDTHVCTPCTDTDALTCNANEALSCATEFLSDGACVPSCPYNTYAVGHVCTSCADPSAVYCDSEGVATLCEPGTSLSNGACVSTCPSGTFSKATGPDFGRSCVACSTVSPDAATCDSNGAATSCSTLFLSGSSCVASCPSNTITGANACKTCPYSQFADFSTNTCKSCRSKFPHATGCTATAPTYCDTYYTLSSNGLSCVASA